MKERKIPDSKEARYLFQLAEAMGLSERLVHHNYVNPEEVKLIQTKKNVPGDLAKRLKVGVESLIPPAVPQRKWPLILGTLEGKHYWKDWFEQGY